MFLLRRPGEDRMRRFVAEREGAPLTYPEVGASRDATVPPGYRANHAHVRLGRGEAAYRRAVEAVRRWAMYDMDWVELLWPDTPIEPGQVVGNLVRHYGFWSMHACRIVYVVDEAEGPVRRFGFGYGTVADHAERGEERFTVEWRREDDSVHYELFSFSRPAAPLAVIGRPIARRLQERFARESARAMREAVREPGPASAARSVPAGG
ncbi:MAG TPA: DUF1990 domain-containing protein [Longimicrobiaceae bacterium]|nr:DUF1990 domain-containing protein [Longimicrobiaceae bacterium]